MANILVTDLSSLYDHVDTCRPTRLVSIVGAREQPPTPPSIDADRHLRVECEDVIIPTAAHAPRREQIEALIGFFRDSPDDETMLIHCSAGWSRSPAAAFIALTWNAEGHEERARQVFRESAPWVDPNELMLDLADDLLHRNGKLAAAGRGVRDPEVLPEFGLIVLPRSLADAV